MELSNYLIYIIALSILAIVSVIGFFIISKQNKALSISNTRIIGIYLAVAIFISACGFVGWIPSVTGTFMFFPFLQLFFLGIGFLVSYLWNKNSSDMIPGNKTMLSGILFILVNTILGMIGFSIIFGLRNPEIAPYYALSIIPFVLPYFIKICFVLYTEIPEDIYKIWYYPLQQDDIDFDKIDTSTIYMMELEYTKSVSDDRIMNTKLRAPLGMKFGDWFRSFIEDYNYKYDSDPIRFTNEDQTAQGWIFYVKPSFLGGSRYIDPEKTIAENGLVEKKAIIARRVGIVEEEEMN